MDLPQFVALVGPDGSQWIVGRHVVAGRGLPEVRVLFGGVLKQVQTGDRDAVGDLHLTLVHVLIGVGGNRRGVLIIRQAVGAADLRVRCAADP